MRGIVEVQRIVADVLHKIFELGIVLVHSAELDNALAHIRGKLVAQRPPRHAHNRKLLRQQAVLLQMKQRRQQLALGQSRRRRRKSP